MSILKEFRSVRSDQMTMNLPRGNEVDPGVTLPWDNTLSYERKVTRAIIAPA